MHEAVILVAKYLIIISLLLTLVVWLKLPRKDKLDFAIIIIVSGIVAYVLAHVGKALYYDPRPFVAGHFTPYFSHGADNGFPSDHTLLASLLGYVVILYRRWPGACLLALALLIGLARVVAGVHHLVDIAGAFLITFISVLIVSIVYRKLKESRA